VTAVALSTTLDRPRRVLAVLECVPSDEAVREQAVAVASECGAYLTLVAVAPLPFRFNPGPYCIPRVSSEELRAQAAAVLVRAAALVPPDIPLITGVDQGKTADVIARRVESGAHDLVIVRRRRLRPRSFARAPRVPVLAVTG
jgi:hypothetical protein